MSAICQQLHQLINLKPILHFPFNTNDIPRNGIYILFEMGETGHGTNRIVRIGTHTGANQLPNRLKDHFVKENKDRSIFRKNIGRALLNRDGDPFLKYWEIDLTSHEAKVAYRNAIDLEMLKKIEERVSDTIRRTFSFVVFQVDDKEKRLQFESRMISTISLCKDCKPSNTWLGLHSTKERIRESGLWLVNELYKTPLSEQDFSDMSQWELLKHLQMS